MKRYLTLFTSAAIFAALPLTAQEQAKKDFPAPSEIVAAAKAEEWVVIVPSDLLVMDLAPDAKGKARRAVIQLMPAPFSQGWVGNIRKLAAAKFWDGTSINRVQDNYVTQWGDATEKKALPDGLAVVPESDYHERKLPVAAVPSKGDSKQIIYTKAETEKAIAWMEASADAEIFSKDYSSTNDAYATLTRFEKGWPTGLRKDGNDILTWPTHCYGMVGVGRNLSPDTGTGAELYTVIGHAPRHLDRNIALVGRVIEGMEHLSSLPRGTGALGFYETEGERVPIISVRLASDMASDKALPAFEYLSTESDSFAKYADARANRRDPFFNVPAGGADICNIPVPVRRKAAQ